jgi:phosphopantetheinyl transferase (holo-ACP synthase)
MGSMAQICLLPLPPSVGSREERSAASRAAAEARLLEATGARVEIASLPKGDVETRWADGSTGEGPTPELSFSYCEGWAGFAFAGVKRLGFDVEPSASVSVRAARRAMSAADEERFDEMGEEERRRVATRYWTAAEAVSKAAGVGLPMLLRRELELGLAPQGSWGKYRFAVAETYTGLTCALAVEGELDPRDALARTVVLG